MLPDVRGLAGLDIGCGEGHNTRLLAGRGARLTAIDISEDVPFKVKTSARGYLLEAFLPPAVLHGYDPEQNRRLGLYYAVHDNELGEQVLSVGAEFPYVAPRSREPPEP